MESNALRFAGSDFRLWEQGRHYACGCSYTNDYYDCKLCSKLKHFCVHVSNTLEWTNHRLCSTFLQIWQTVAFPFASLWDQLQYAPLFFYSRLTFHGHEERNLITSRVQRKQAPEILASPSELDQVRQATRHHRPLPRPRPRFSTRCLRADQAHRSILFQAFLYFLFEEDEAKKSKSYRSFPSNIDIVTAKAQRKSPGCTRRFNVNQRINQRLLRFCPLNFFSAIFVKFIISFR